VAAPNGGNAEGPQLLRGEWEDADGEKGWLDRGIGSLAANAGSGAGDGLR
jgi:hypothetical protein